MASPRLSSTPCGMPMADSAASSCLPSHSESVAPLRPSSLIAGSGGWAGRWAMAACVLPICRQRDIAWVACGMSRNTGMPTASSAWMLLSSAPTQITMMGQCTCWRASDSACTNASAMLCIMPMKSTMACVSLSAARHCMARPIMGVSCSTLPVMSSGLAGCTKLGSTGTRAVSTSGLSGGSTRPRGSQASAISTPAPPETVITASLGPSGVALCSSRRAASIISVRLCTRTAPCCVRQAS
ncbi:hypothetical protein SDC9_116671 [bioreactor metagenome]|uniref:Uncharacterized protein n=1 Tax=bioreactor metagenome TaxID=1076179 RepID=A0A645C308_9ZZZZ